MRKLILAGAATIGIIAAPAALSAQGAPELEASANAQVEAELDAEQRTVYRGWPTETRDAYGQLNTEHRTYFWTLTPTQREAYWRLTPEQRTQIMGMTPEARANAWTSIQAQIAARANNSETSVTARTVGDVSASAQSNAQAGSSATPAAVVRNNPGNLTPPPAAALNKTYPVCTRKMQDNCQNPGEGGAPGRSRALQHWPGEPASERD
jgi:hypothetical protein